MDKQKQVGVYTLTEETKIVDRGGEVAAWWTEVLVPAGEYPVYKSTNIRGGLTVALPGTIIEDNHQSLFGGVPCGGQYDTRKNAGNPYTYQMFVYDFMAEENDKFTMFN